MLPSRQCSDVFGPVPWFIIGKLRDTVIPFRILGFFFRTLIHLSLSSLFPLNQRSVCVIAPWLRLQFRKCWSITDDAWKVCPPVSESQGSGWIFFCVERPFRSEDSSKVVLAFPDGDRSAKAGFRLPFRADSTTFLSCAGVRSLNTASSPTDDWFGCYCPAEGSLLLSQPRMLRRRLAPIPSEYCLFHYPEYHRRDRVSRAEHADS